MDPPVAPGTEAAQEFVSLLTLGSTVPFKLNQDRRHHVPHVADQGHGASMQQSSCRLSNPTRHH